VAFADSRTLFHVSLDVVHLYFTVRAHTPGLSQPCKYVDVDIVIVIDSQTDRHMVMRSIPIHTNPAHASVCLEVCTLGVHPAGRRYLAIRVWRSKIRTLYFPAKSFETDRVVGSLLCTVLSSIDQLVLA